VAAAPAEILQHMLTACLSYHRAASSVGLHCSIAACVTLLLSVRCLVFVLIQAQTCMIPLAGSFCTAPSGLAGSSGAAPTGCAAGARCSLLPEESMALAQCCCLCHCSDSSTVAVPASTTHIRAVFLCMGFKMGH
jgi:hypothetical protein